MIEDDQVQDQDDQEEDPSGCALDFATNGVDVNDEALMERIEFCQKKVCRNRKSFHNIYFISVFRNLIS